MGLDAFCNGLSVRVGSYSTVQEQRVGWIKAEALRQPESADKILAVLTKEGGIDYEAFDNLPCDLLLVGTRAFVYHSDCDGEWTAEESEWILEAIDTLPLADTKECGSQWFMTADGEYYLSALFRESVKSGERVRLT